VTDNPRRGDVWWTELDPARGDEGRKTRPSVVLSDEGIGRLALRIVVPATEWRERYEIAPWMVRVAPRPENGLAKESAADAFQVRSISIDRLHAGMGTLESVPIDAVAEAVTLCIGYAAQARADLP
jgi:mRNA interferase MazF